MTFTLYVVPAPSIWAVMFTLSSMTWLLVSTRPFEVMIIPVPATWPLPAAVSALMSTTAESMLAMVAAESAPPVEGTLLPVLGVLPMLFEPPEGDDPLGVGEVIEAVVSAHAVPPPAPTHTIAKAASAVRRKPEPPRRFCEVGGQLGGPHSGSDDHGP